VKRIAHRSCPITKWLVDTDSALYRNLEIFKILCKKRCFVKYKTVAIVVLFLYIRKVEQEEEETGVLKR
jgi:hypothetical protein